MSKDLNQRLRLLYISDILSEKTDTNHGISLYEIMALLEQHEIRSDRKTLTKDLEELSYYGLDIVRYKRSRKNYYSLASRKFEPSEVRLLINAVTSLRSFAPKRSGELIKKLLHLTSIYDSKKIQSLPLPEIKTRTDSENILKNADIINDAIAKDRCLKFLYRRSGIKKRLEDQNDHSALITNPFSLIIDNGYYYLIGYRSDLDHLEHYRVDKMKDLMITDKKREGIDKIRNLSMSEYFNGLFDMADGDSTRVNLVCDNALSDTLIDRFGADIPMIPIDPSHFKTSIRVSLSREFLSWVFSFGNSILITGPKNVTDEVKEEIKRLTKQYLPEVQI